MLNKKARKIIFIFILFLITIVFKLPSVEASTTYQFGDTAKGVLDDNGTLTISGTSTTKEVTANGTYKVYVKNKAGTIVEKSITINKIDKIAPIIKLTANTVDGADTNTQMILTVDATDNEDGVGLSEQPYSWDEGKTWTSEKTKTITENGKYVVYVKDALGNVSNREIVVSEIETYIKADINNDGKIDVTDLIILKRHIIAPNGSNWVLTGIKLLAADINGDGKVDVTDLYQLKRKVLNKD